ncbi:MAG: radical SAM protein [Nanoarchaeota archaeon]
MGVTKVPYRINWETKEICNEHCTFCFATFELPADFIIPGTESQEELRKTLTTEEVKSLVNQASAVGVHEFLFGGGDPFIRKDMSELIKYTAERGLKVLVDTNALIVSSKMRLLDDIANSIYRLGIPFDGPNAEINDKMRDMPGAFEKAMKLLSSSQDKPYQIKVNTVVTAQNYHAIPDMVNTFTEYRVNRWSLDQFIPLMRGSDYRKVYEIQDQLYRDTVAKVKERMYASGLSIDISGGTEAEKSGTVLLFSPQGVAYVSRNSEKQYIASIRNTNLKQIVEASSLDMEKHKLRYGAHV